MIEKVTKIFGTGFAVFWMIFTLLEYWQYHEETRRSIQLFQYSGLALLLLTLGAAIVFCLVRFQRSSPVKHLLNGLGITLLFTLIAVLCMNAFARVNFGSLLSLTENVSLLGNLLGTALAVYFILMVSYSTGRVIGQAFSMNFIQSLQDLVNIGIGIMAIVFLLFLLGALGLLFSFVLWPLFVLLLLLSWKSALHFLKITLWEPIPAVKNINALGQSLFFLIAVLVTMNFIQVVRPYPTGFDAMTQYINISSLVRDYNALVQGFGAYNWSLYMALGYLLFDHTAVTLSLSFAGVILSLVALYQLSRKWMDVNYSLLVVFLFISMPMSGWLSFRDMKVDMGLLFYSLLILLLLYDWLAKGKDPEVPAPEKAGKKKKRAPKREVTPERSWEISAIQKRLMVIQPPLILQNSRLALIGIFIGFSMGIKFTALIILLAVIPGIAYAKGGKLAFSAALALVLAAVLIARFDAQAALRPLHLWVDLLQWLLLLVGVGLGVVFFYRKKERFFKVLKMSLICVFFSGLFLSPWLLKNALETRSIRISNITGGKKAGPQPTVVDIEKAYQNQKNEN